MRQDIENIIRARWAAPDDDLRAAIRAEAWTGHNIPITATESTLGSGPELIGDNRRTLTIKSLIRRSHGHRDTITVLDLGSLEGGLSFEMAREGWNATGVEGRDANFQKAQLIASYYALPNLRFLHKDVKELSSKDGTFDVILCCGLLYHLDEPIAHLRQLSSLLADDGLLFLDTHVAPDEHAARYGTHEKSLSEPVTFVESGHEYDGRWWSEPAEGDLKERMWSAISNERSMWLSRRSLIRALYHSGFEAIEELYGIYEIESEFALRDQFSRLYLACARKW